MLEPMITCLQLSYGRPQLSVEAVESFLRQTYQNKELIIINTHHSPVHLAQTYDNITVYNLGGFSHLANVVRFAISLVRTPFYCLWHDDDIYLPWHLEQRMAFRLNHERYNAIGHRFGLVAVANQLTELTSNMFATQYLYDNNGILPQFNTSCWDANFYYQWHHGHIGLSASLPSYIFRWDTGENHIGSAPDEVGQHQNYLQNLIEKSKLDFVDPWVPMWHQDYVTATVEFLQKTATPVDAELDTELPVSSDCVVFPLPQSFDVESALSAITREPQTTSSPLAQSRLAPDAFSPIVTSGVDRTPYLHFESLIKKSPQYAEVNYQQYQIQQLVTDYPKVSVLFVARDENEWLRKCLESLIAGKNDTSYEIIVYDDASSDNCLEGIVAHSVWQSTQGSIGPSRARNTAARQARGEFLIFGDAHLKFEDHWIDKLLAPIIDDRCDAVNPIISDIAVPSTLGYGWDFDLISYEYKWGNPTHEFKLMPGMAGGCFAIKQQVFQQVGMFDSSFVRWGMEDSELSLRLRLSGYRLAVEPLVNVGHFFKDTNEYNVDWLSYNYNFLRMAYVNMDQEGLNYVYSLIPGEPADKRVLLDFVVKQSQARKDFCAKQRKLEFYDYLQQFGRAFS